MKMFILTPTVQERMKMQEQKEQRARRNAWLCAFLFALLLISACSFLTISGHAATFAIGSEEQPVNWALVSPGVWRANLLNATATATAEALLTVDQNDALAAWQQTAELYFYRVQAGVYEFLKIADANTVTPVVAGNKITWASRWTFVGGSADLEIVVTDWRILKTVRFSAAAGAVLPSPTGAAYFHGAPESEIGLAIGSDPFVGERAPNVTGEMDGVTIDLDDDQVIGASMTLKWNGAFLHSFPPAYCEGMDGLDVQGQQIYLGDLQMHFAAWGWAQAKAAAWFDPSYSFQGGTYIADTFDDKNAASTNYETATTLAIGTSGEAGGARGYIDFDMPAIAAAYYLASTTNIASSSENRITAFDFKMMTNGTGTAANIGVWRSQRAQAVNAITYNTRSLSPAHLLYTQTIASWAAGATTTFSDSSLLVWANASIVAATRLQLHLRDTVSADLGVFYSEDNATEHLRPVLEITITHYVSPEYSALSALIYPDKAQITDSTTATLYAHVNTQIDGVNYDVASASPVNAKYFLGANDNFLQCGTSTIAYKNSYDRPDYAALTILIPSAMQSKNLILAISDTVRQASATFSMQTPSGSGSSVDNDAIATAVVGKAINSGETLSQAVGRISGITTAISTNNAAIIANNVLLNQIDFRAKEIQKDTAAGGRVIPASGIASIGFNANLTQENAWDVQLFGESYASTKPNLTIRGTAGKGPTTHFTYNIPTLGDSITYVGAYDAGIDAAITGATVYTHVYTLHVTPAYATGVFHVAGLCSNTTRTWALGGDFVFGATPNLAITDQLTATAFDARADAWDTMLDNAAAGEIVSATVWRANALITRTTAGINIDDATDSVYIPLDGDYGYERTYRKTDGTLFTIRMLADHDEATTDKKTSKYRVIGTDTTIQTWAADQGHSISASGRTTP